MRLILAFMLAFPAVLQAAPSCSVGGGTVVDPVPETCEESHLRRMTFAPANNCTTPRIAQCRDNFLPLYKEFNDTELDLIRQYMNMESYESAVDSSSYFLAYNIQKFLGGDSALPFQLLLEGLWYDSARSYPDQTYMENFFYEAVGAVNRAAPEDLAALHGLIAFAYLQTGDLSAAQNSLSQSLEQGPATVIVSMYQMAVGLCLEDEASPFCDPSTPIPSK